MIREEVRDVLRKAFQEKNIEASQAAHQVGPHEHHPGSAEYLRDVVLGGIDGIVTTFAVVSGVEGASLSTGVILVLGAANLIADGFSMAVGNYLGSLSEAQYFKTERERESWEIDNVPDHEEDEIRDIYLKKGFKGELLEQIVKHITSDKELWIDTMMKEELNIIEEQRNPMTAGLSTFVSFVIFGSIPLSIYLYAYLGGPIAKSSLFSSCIVATGLALFIVGALRARFTLKSRTRSGFEILVVGGLAGALAYFVGYVLKGIM